MNMELAPGEHTLSSRAGTSHLSVEDEIENKTFIIKPGECHQVDVSVE